LKKILGEVFKQQQTIYSILQYTNNLVLFFFFPTTYTKKMTSTTTMATTTQPLITPSAVMDSALGTRVLILMKNNKELEGKLIGVDEYINVVLEDVIEYDATDDGVKEVARRPQLLLNGANIAMLVPRDAGKKN
jgi:U6 snRNA-associated Sm-like protein LSm5